jgi:hypothetical protein
MEMGKTDYDIEVLCARLAAARERALRLAREAERLVAEAKLRQAEREDPWRRAGRLARGGKEPGRS